MILINTEDIKDGMKLAKDLIDGNGNLILGKGHTLYRKHIKTILSLGFTKLYVLSPDEEELPAEEDTEILSTKNKVAALRIIHKATQEAYKKVDLKQIRLQGKEILDLIENIIAELLKKDELVVNMFELKKHDDYTFFHSTSVTVLSLILGIKIGLSLDQLRQLGYGALLHDIGKTKVPKDILNKSGTLTAEEMETMKKHTIWGFEILKAQGFLPYESCLVALQHHEKLNGTGYPYSLSSSEIHLFSKITAIADVYDALTSDRPYRDALLPHLALEYLMGGVDTYFDFNLVREFMKFISIYPVGTMVELNTKEIGIVIKTYPGQSARPVVRVFFDRDKKLLSHPIDRDLTKEYTTFITRIVEKSPF